MIQLLPFVPGGTGRDAGRTRAVGGVGTGNGEVTARVARARM